jgi:parallel beta-helix repeat protein
VGSGSSADGKAATYIVAASNSIGRQYADFQATSSAQDAINRAISAAYSASRGAGGAVYLLEGDYVMGTSTASGASVTMATSTSLIGVGKGTKLIVASSTPGDIQVISGSSTPFLSIRNLVIDGNQANQSIGSHDGIYLLNVSSSTIDSVTVDGMFHDGVVSTWSGSANTFSNNTISSSLNRNMWIQGDRNTITGNTIIDGGNNALQVEAWGNIVTGNHIVGNTGAGIWLHGGASDTIVSGNFIANNNMGISTGYTQNNTITNNIFTDNSLAGEDTIRLNGGTVGELGGNFVANNKFFNSNGLGTAIYIEPTVNPNTIVGNVYSGFGALPITDFATGTTRYTQWDRLTLDTTQLGQVAYSPLSIFASSSVALASTTQMGTGKIANFFASSSQEVFTILNNGYLGLGTSSPLVRLAVVGRALFTSTTTIGDYTASNAAGLQIGYGGLCVDNDGTCDASTTGRFAARSFMTGASDLAENYFATTTLEAGEIVMIAATDTPSVVTQAELAYPSRVLGIVSTKPGITLTDDFEKLGGQVPVALSGRVPVKVTLKGGAIKQGDRIMLSDIPGVGEKANGTSTVTVGIALEDWQGDANIMDTAQIGEVLVFVSLKHAAISEGVVAGMLSLANGSTTVPLWTIDSTTGEISYLADRALNMNGQSLKNVRSIFAQNGTWSLDENGHLVVEGLEVKKSLKVGSPQERIGVTLYDEVDGSPYCIKMVAGTLASLAGECGTQTHEEVTSTPPPAPSVHEEVSAQDQSGDIDTTPPATEEPTPPQSQSTDPPVVETPPVIIETPSTVIELDAPPSVTETLQPNP